VPAYPPSAEKAEAQEPPDLSIAAAAAGNVTGSSSTQPVP